jgi:hypothetical protein
MFMKKATTVLLSAIALPWVTVATFAALEETTTTVTEGAGTITEYAPGQTIVLKESRGPAHYRVSEKTTYVTRSGQVISGEELRTRVKVGTPVRLHYARKGADMIVDRVVVDEP